VDLADVAQELYGLVPGDFTRERNERAKELKREDAELAAQVKALARPTTAGWLVNQLVRHHGDEVEQVAAIGAALRDAQEDLDRDQLLQLNKQRQGVLRAVTQQARALAKQLGNPVSGAIADEVEQTLRAVMSDPDAADAVRTGTLLKSLSSTGFASVDLTDAVAVPSARSGDGRPPAALPPSASGGRSVRAGTDAGAPATKGRDRKGHDDQRKDDQRKDELAERRRQHEREQRERERAERALAEARAQAEEADAAAAQADDALDEAQASVEELGRRQEDLERRLHELEHQVRDVQDELTAVQRESRSAERDRDRTRHESEVAHRAADRARTRVDRLS
jgi:chromosome segregation ATPase